MDTRFLFVLMYEQANRLLIFYGFSGILDMIKQMPWWLFFAISFVGFGGAMAIVDTKAKTK